jgi:hypothetical protein
LVEEYVSEAQGLSFRDDLGWVATGHDVKQVVMIPERCAAHRIQWSSRRGLQINTGTTEVALIPPTPGHKNHLWPKLTAKIWVGDGFIVLNRQATRWLGAWLGVHLTLKEHPTQCMKKATAAEA